MTKEELKRLPDMSLREACELIGVDHYMVILRYLNCNDCPLHLIENCSEGCAVTIKKFIKSDNSD